LDSLFVPQDHPAREMQDTFYVKETQDIPEKTFSKVSKMHLKGLDEKSKGWGEVLDLQVSKKMLLRTHCTVLSARTLASLKEEDLPGKFFSIGKVFRNEALDWSHLFEFYQIEGIVVSDSVNFSCLKGYLREFYKKMGYDKVRIKPSFFPYTEPSAEIEVYLEKKKTWMELGGAGLFRPEVTKALFGREIPVLAWGLGMGRIIMPYYEFSDIRDIYKNDLSMLRTIKKFSRV
jgi:phenylalanyl-tRNA synthetase alpha chain